jgi:hypothetical protein
LKGEKRFGFVMTCVVDSPFACLPRYEELIEECKELRKHIQKVASDYDLEYDQSNSSSGIYKRAIEIVQKREAQEQQRVAPKSEEEEEEEANKEKDKNTEEESNEEKEERKAKGSS